MNTNKYKNKVRLLIGKDVRLKVNIGRNKYEYYNGIILDTYDKVFTVKVNDIIKSFSYTDLLTKNVLIKLI